jgi:dolichol-phosphate mannosyltransferase
MDADLQHPPEVLEALLAEGERSDADLVVASRYCAGGEIAEFSPARRAVSRASGRLACALFPGRLSRVSDPMSGFFLVRRDAIELSRLRPDGFKILLEILVAGPELRVSEVPFRFGERAADESKASLGEGARYLQRLVELRLGDRGVRLLKFGLVGALGVVLNTAILQLLVSVLHVFYVAASIVATEVAIVCNYALSELFVFRGAAPVRRRPIRLASYVALENCSLLLSVPLLALFVSVAGLGLVLANVLALAALGLLRFAVADAFVWGPARLLPRRGHERRVPT